VYSGQLAALATAVCWTVTALAFESAGKRIGSLAVNFIRLIMAVFFLAGAAWLFRGVVLPVDATLHAWFWLSISGVIGFTIGDLCLFEAFVVIGSRRSMLLMSLVPPMTALIGWMVMGEVLTLQEWTGMALTVGGVAWVISERAPASDGAATTGPSLGGVLLGLGGALGQAVGLVLSKYGMQDYSALAATQIRVFAGIVGFAILFAFIGWWPRVWLGVKNRAGMTRTTVGAFFGPFLGVTGSLLAVKYTEAGVAATIMAIVPVMIIPPAVIMYKERISARAVAGAVLAVVGVGLLFL
jgi:drug/metabolite transporter (DMT)-like permease